MSKADIKTMNLKLADRDGASREVVKRMGNFIAYAEVFENQMGQWQKDIEQRIHANNALIQNQLDELRETAENLRDVMTEAGVARWRIAAEESLKAGKQHIHTLENICEQHQQAIQSYNDEFKKTAKTSFDRLDRASAYTIKNISEAISSFRISDFQRLTEQSCEIVAETSNSAIIRLKETVRWFHWKNLGLALAITLFASLTVGLYLNDEMPWDIHKHVVAQRNAGTALLNAWPSLSQSERQRILNHSKKAFT